MKYGALPGRGGEGRAFSTHPERNGQGGIGDQEALDAARETGVFASDFAPQSVLSATTEKLKNAGHARRRAA